VTIGETYSGYTTLEPIGQGAMGEVFLARKADGAQGVVKLLATSLAADAHSLARFAREAEALRKLPPHENLVAVLAVSGLPAPHIVMECVNGPSLKQKLTQERRLQPLLAARYGRDAARGLAVAHAHGLVHRDVKPASKAARTACASSTSAWPRTCS
jgi:serine/threonine protein kinase